MSIIINAKTISMVHTNKTGNKCVDVDVVQNGTRTRVFTCLVTITLTEYKTAFNLKAVIDAYKQANPQYAQATNFKIINTRLQPQLSTGDLTGLTVEFYNTGTIAGMSTSGTAMIITSPMKLSNHGWIRGAGGRGGYGGQGGKSGPLSKQVPNGYGSWKVLPYKPAVNIWAAQRNPSNGHTVLTVYYNRHKVTRDITAHPLPKTTGGIPYIMITGVPCTSGFGYNHVGNHSTIAYGRVIYKTVTVAGHIGGAGGHGGQGIWFKHNATKGVAGVVGGLNTGGYRGGTGGTGGTGGDWGKAGARGHQGATGAGKGAVGLLGPMTGSHAPTGAGKAIKGKVNLVKGSLIGTGISGPVI